MDHAGPILFPFPIHQRKRLCDQGATSFTIKDRGKEGIKYLSLILIFGHFVALGIQQEMAFLIAKEAQMQRSLLESHFN